MIMISRRILLVGVNTVTSVWAPVNLICCFFTLILTINPFSAMLAVLSLEKKNDQLKYQT